MPPRNEKHSRWPSLLKSYWLDLLGLIFFAFGIFLMVEQLDIRENLFLWLLSIQAHSKLFVKSALGILLRLTLSDFVGLVLVLSAAVFIAWRIHTHLIQSEKLRAGDCPRCGSGLRRIRRSFLDRVICRVTFIHFRRYVCMNRACGWTGLRRRRPHERDVTIQKPASTELTRGSLPK